MATLKFIQAQSFQLQASGASTGDTSITLQSFKMIDGTTNIVTADLGDRCYGTLEPNNGTQEEAIQFTGVTQNASGTATLTGVSSVAFKSPYTVTSGLSKSHAGGVTFILSNDAAFYGNIKSYIDTVVASGAAFADTLTAGITKLSVTPATGSNPVAVGDNDPRIPSALQISYIPTALQKDALAGSFGTPSSGNTYVTSSDTSNWRLLSETTLASASSVISAASFAARSSLWIELSAPLITANPTPLKLTFNGDSGANYGHNLSTNNGAFSTVSSGSSLPINALNANNLPRMSIIRIPMNETTKGKFVYVVSMSSEPQAATPPGVEEVFGVWANASAQITTVTVTTTASTLASGCRLSVYGAN